MTHRERVQTAVDVIVIAGCLGVAVYVALKPNAFYEKTPRVVLFTIVALLVAVLFATRAQAQLKLELRGLLFTASGAMAAFFALIMLLSHLTRSEDRVTVLRFEERNGSETALAAHELSVATNRGREVEICIKGSRAYALYSDEVPALEVTLGTARQLYRASVPVAQSASLRKERELKEVGK